VLSRDHYIDTDDDQLQRRGITCRLRLGSDDRRLLTLFVGVESDSPPPRRFDALVQSADPRVVLAGDSEPARRLAGIIDTRLLQIRMELQLERVERVADHDWRDRPRLRALYDRVHVRGPFTSRAFHQLTVRSRARSTRAFEMVVADLQDREGLRAIV